MGKDTRLFDWDIIGDSILFDCREVVSSLDVDMGDIEIDGEESGWVVVKESFSLIIFHS